MPDSFARVYRKRNCDPSTNTGGSFPEAHGMRLAEIQYAVQRIKGLPWVDHRNVFLMGHSEGGKAVADYDGDEYKGYIIMGWNCPGHSAGLQMPQNKPVLALLGSHDPWNHDGGNCGRYMGSRPNARSVVVDTYEHHVTDDPVAQKALLKFLKEHSSSQ